jgi:transcriptional regulator with XRE-family HTH domain
MMIRSETDYREAVARSRKSEERLVEYREELRRKGLLTDEVEMTVSLAVNILDDLNDEIGCYERVKQGDLSGFKTLRDLGQLLIAARLARGLSQRDLAEKLHVHESQVSRDEKNEYQGISLERAAQVFEALAIDVDVRASLAEKRNGGAVGHSGESADAAASNRVPERHEVKAGSHS